MESAYYVDTGLLSAGATGIQIMSIFGSSTVASVGGNKSGRPAAKPSSTTAAPPFPTFLLPSLPLQLFRRRQRHQHPPSAANSAHANGDWRDGGASSDEDGADTDDEVAPPSLSGSVDSASSSSASEGGAGTDAPRRHRRRLAPPTPATLRCGICATDIAFASQIVSKGFTGRHGRAFLVAPASASNMPSPSAVASAAPAGELVNIRMGRSENRQLVTGSHVVADISCRVCGTKVGWKYVDAREAQQKYKVGKFILETARVVVWRGWEAAGREPQPADGSDDDCDDLYDDQDYHLDYREDEEDVGAWSADEAGPSKDGPDDGPIVFDSDDDDECEDLFAGTWNAETAAKRRKMRRALVGRRV